MALTPTTVRTTFLPTDPSVTPPVPPQGAVVFTATDRIETPTSGEEVEVDPVNAPVATGQMTAKLYPGNYVVQVMLEGVPEPHSRLATIAASEEPVWLGSCYTDTSPPT